MIKNAINIVWKSVVTVMVGALIGAFVLMLAFCLPVSQKNADASYTIMEKEGWYPVAPILSHEYNDYFQSYLPGVLDNFTDYIMLSTAMDNSEGSPLVRAMNMHSDYIQMDYSYYWHGYVSILRPLLMAFDYGEIRILNFMGQFVIMFLLAQMVWRKKGKVYAFLMLTSYALLMPQAMSMSLQFTWIFYVAAIGCVLLLWKQELFEEKLRYVLLFTAIGMFTSYFDLLTYPLFTWGFPLVWWLVMQTDSKSGLKRLVQVIVSGVSWIFGYFVFWMMKWIFANIVLKQDIFTKAINEVLFCSGQENSGQYGTASRLEAITINWKHYEYSIYMLILMAWLLWVIISSIRNGFRARQDSWAYLLIGMSSPVWYFALVFHTAAHHFFTYRIFGVSILAFLVLLVSSTERSKKEHRKLDIQERMIIIGMWIIISIPAFGLATLAKEEKWVLNGADPCTEVLVPDGSSIVATFTPIHDEIKNISFSLKSESTKGYYEILVFNREALSRVLQIPIEDYKGTSYNLVDVYWRLNGGNTYQIVIVAKDNDKPVYAMVTEPDYTTLEEYGSLTIGGEETEGQLVTAMTYFSKTNSKKTLLFMTCTWLGIITSFGVAIYSMKDLKGRA